MMGHTCKPSSGDVETGRSVGSLASQPSLFDRKPQRECFKGQVWSFKLVVLHLLITCAPSLVPTKVKS